MKLLPLLAAALLVAAPASAESLRLMSYNIRYANPQDVPPWPERGPRMAAQIAFLAPDVLGVQEALLPMVDDLSQALEDYDHYGVGRDDGAKAGESTTVFWRRDRFEKVSASTQWCGQTPDTPSKDADAALPRTFTRLILKDKRSGQVFDVRNAHFDHVGVKARENCAAQILSLPTVPGAHLIVLGDFNTGMDSAPYRRFTADTSPLKDSRVASVRRFGPIGTFNGFDIRQTDGEAIDHIFVDRALSVTRFATLTDSFSGKVISDHFPIVADIELK
jgi:endonuclease/exonuclease/phosphatase family metal-dependent hydrolase